VQKFLKLSVGLSDDQTNLPRTDQTDKAEPFAAKAIMGF
jgi:hypothetical protein